MAGLSLTENMGLTNEMELEDEIELSRDPVEKPVAGLSLAVTEAMVKQIEIKAPIGKPAEKSKVRLSLAENENNSTSEKGANSEIIILGDLAEKSVAGLSLANIELEVQENPAEQSVSGLS